MPKQSKLRFNKFGSGILKGMSVTMKNLLGRAITTSYPEHKLVVSKRFRGNDFVWYPDKCTGCATCAKSCPQGNVKVVTKRGEENAYDVETFEIDTGRCTFCGLCVESCPYDALCLGREYELAQYRRGGLVLSKKDLLESEARQPSGYFRPKIEKKLPKQTLLLERAGRKKSKNGSSA
ncbi:MAG: NADH-quinone oxidoreductase subunit I [Chloroflexi bacterium]|nr:NADH-quinone oxidoreductase subunit I [Chloroflexota bacterium]